MHKPALHTPIQGSIQDPVQSPSFAEDNILAQSKAIPAHDAPAGDSINVTELPEEVKKNLVGYADMELDHMLIKTLKLFPHPVKVDWIIMTLWISFQYQVDRKKVIARLKKMADDGLASKVAGTKGTYELTEAGKVL